MSIVATEKDSEQALQCLIKESDITLKEMLGKGAFGYVRSAEWKTESNKKVNLYHMHIYYYTYMPFIALQRKR